MLSSPDDVVFFFPAQGLLVFDLCTMTVVERLDRSDVIAELHGGSASIRADVVRGPHLLDPSGAPSRAVGTCFAWEAAPRP